MPLLLMYPIIPRVKLEVSLKAGADGKDSHAAPMSLEQFSK